MDLQETSLKRHRVSSRRMRTSWKGIKPPGTIPIRGATPIFITVCALSTAKGMSLIMHMLHHISFGVLDLDKAADFYDAVLGCLGFVRVWTDATAVGYGVEGEGDKFAIMLVKGTLAIPQEGFHLAFSAESREQVDLFYAAALKHGGVGELPPALHPEYGPSYYAAYVTDPEGYYIEAVINTEI